MIAVTLRCVPPSVTAQMKRLRIVHGKPMFFHSDRMKREEQTWFALLRPHAPAAPIDGPVALAIRMVWPHLKSTKKAEIGQLLPKISKPDCSNVSKHLEDVLVKLRFITNDAHVARHVIEKFHGPESAVGIRIQIDPMSAGEAIHEIRIDERSAAARPPRPGARTARRNQTSRRR